MSVRIMAEVWEHSQQSGSKLLLMLAIADYANDERRVAWPSYETLAAKCRMSRRHILRMIGELEESGELEVERGGGRGQSNRYTVTGYHCLEDRQKGDISDKRVTSEPVKGDISDLNSDIAVSPEPSLEPSFIEPPLEPMELPVAVLNKYFDMLGREPRSGMEVDTLLADVVERPSHPLSNWEEAMQIAVKADRLSWRYILGCVDRMNGDGASTPREHGHRLRREAIACYEDGGGKCYVQPDNLIMEKCGQCPRVVQIREKQARTARPAKGSDM